MKSPKKDSDTTVNYRNIVIQRSKHIALIAHDNKKDDLVDWADYNRELLTYHKLSGTGTTGGQLKSELGLDVQLFKSGPLGGDQQVGSKIAQFDIDFVIFFWDPMSAQPHDVDVKALLRLAAVYNIPVACNRASADFMISSPLMDTSYDRRVENYSKIFDKTS